MKGTISFLLIPVMLLCMFAIACDQDSIFYDIYNEPEPKDALIPGSPTNIVVVRDRLYVGSRMGNKIFSYSSSGITDVWNTVALSNGALGDLTTDGEYLYALVFPGGDPLGSSAIRRYNPGSGSWDREISSEDYSIQTIYGAGGNIFAGGQSKSNRQSFAVLYLDTSSFTLSVSIDQTSLLKGAVRDAGGNIYLATMGSGIFMFNRGAINGPLNGTSQAIITGIIETGGVIVAVGNAGTIYYGSTGSFNQISNNVNYTGALCVWLDPANQWRPSLLLMGIRGKGTSLVHGYQEMILENGNPTFKMHSPGNETPSSVKSRSKYTAAIGLHPVVSILQVPGIGGGPLDYGAFAGESDWEPPIFASTAKDGLWSYRNGEWNAED